MKHCGPFVITAIDEVEADDIDLDKHVADLQRHLGTSVNTSRYII